MNKELKQRAREFRKTMTDTENLLWYYLRGRRLQGYKCTREQVIGHYIVDFVCHQKKIIIEVDGGQYAEMKAVEYDKNRTEFLKEKGYQVLRVWNNDVLDNIQGVLEAILNLLEDVPNK